MSSPEMKAWAEKWSQCVEDENSVCTRSGEAPEKFPPEDNIEKYRALKKMLEENPNPSLSQELDEAWSKYSQDAISDEEIDRIMRKIEDELRMEETPPLPDDESSEPQEVSIEGKNNMLVMLEGQEHAPEFDIFEFAAQSIEYLG